MERKREMREDSARRERKNQRIANSNHAVTKNFVPIDQNEVMMGRDDEEEADIYDNNPQYGGDDRREYIKDTPKIQDMVTQQRVVTAPRQRDWINREEDLRRMDTKRDPFGPDADEIQVTRLNPVKGESGGYVASPSQGIDTAIFQGAARTPKFDPMDSAAQQYMKEDDSDYRRRAYHNQNIDRRTPQMLSRPFSADDENSRNESYRLDRGASPQNPNAARGPGPQRSTSKRSPWKKP